VLALVLLAAAACAKDPAAERAVRAVADGIVAADNARDLEGVMASYAEDAILMPPGEAPVQGRAAIRPRYEALFRDFDPAIEPHVEEVCVSGGVAWVRGRNGGRLVPRGGDGTARELDDVYLMLLARGDDGAWRIGHLMWHRRSAPRP
jgi:uncharacterized protein (TIGR02246 family)